MGRITAKENTVLVVLLGDQAESCRPGADCQDLVRKFGAGGRLHVPIGVERLNVHPWLDGRMQDEAVRSVHVEHQPANLRVHDPVQPGTVELVPGGIEVSFKIDEVHGAPEELALHA